MPICYADFPASHVWWRSLVAHLGVFAQRHLPAANWIAGDLALPNPRCSMYGIFAYKTGWFWTRANVGIHIPAPWFAYGNMLEILTNHNPIWEIHPMIVIIAEWLTEKMEWYLPQNIQCKAINVGVQSESQALGHCIRFHWGPTGPKMAASVWVSGWEYSLLGQIPHTNGFQ